MNKLKAVLLVCIFCSLAGCFIFDYGCDDCGNSPEKLPAYVNKSGEMVKIVANYNYHSYTKFITSNDTLHSSYYFKEKPGEWSIPNHADCGIAVGKDCAYPARMELHFLNDLQKCLVFDGPIKHDGIDMRSWDSYEKGRVIENWADFWLGIEYIYTITTEHREMAKEEDCQ